MLVSSVVESVLRLLGNCDRVWRRVVRLAAILLLCSPLALSAAPRVPDDEVLARLVWSTMIAVDNANRTGNYAVLYALGSPGFQSRHSQKDLAQIFAGLRERRIDVGRAVLVAPTYHIPPAITAQGQLRLRGGFEYRPRAIRFDVLFDLVDGGWQIAALSVAEMDAATR